MSPAKAQLAPGIAARAAAQAILGDVLRKRRPLDAALDETFAAAALPARDSGFAHAIASETLRRFGQLESLLGAFVPKSPPPHRAGPTLEILLAGACEILFLGVAAHAAVDAANRLAARDAKAVHFKPLINATLRRIAREGAGVIGGQDAPRLNTPDWLWERWCNSFGDATTRAITQAHGTPPPLDIVLRDSAHFAPEHHPILRHHPLHAGDPISLNVNKEQFASEHPSILRHHPLHAGDPIALNVNWMARMHPGHDGSGDGSPGSEAIVLPGGVLRLRDAGSVETLPGFAEGQWWVQDFAASLPVRLFGDVRGKRVIDLCAAPGGKTAQLAAAGARVTAVEREAPRLARLKSNLERLRLSAECIEADVLDFMPEARADCVLLDAPCSATGTIRRHPDLPWIKSAADVLASARTAYELLDAAAGMVAEGGLLVFAVCSLEEEEGAEQIADFLARHGQFRREPLSPHDVFGMAELIGPDGDLRTLPCHLSEQGGMDGFYAARLRA